MTPNTQWPCSNDRTTSWPNYWAPNEFQEPSFTLLQLRYFVLLFNTQQPRYEFQGSNEMGLNPLIGFRSWMDIRHEAVRDTVADRSGPQIIIARISAICRIAGLTQCVSLMWLCLTTPRTGLPGFKSHRQIKPLEAIYSRVSRDSRGMPDSTLRVVSALVC